MYASLYRQTAGSFTNRRQLMQYFIKPLKLAIIVRADLKLSKGKTASQCAHAAVSCYKQLAAANPQLLKLWLQSGQPKVILKAENIDEIEKLHVHAKELNIISELICDAGRTEIASGTITVLGLGPDYNDQIDKIVKNLKLL